MINDPNARYWLSLFGVMAGCLGIGFAVGCRVMAWKARQIIESGGFERKPVSDTINENDSLGDRDYVKMQSARRTIGKNGIGMFQTNWRFYHPDLGEYKGESIEVRWIENDYTQIWAVLPNRRVVIAFRQAITDHRTPKTV